MSSASPYSTGELQRTYARWAKVYDYVYTGLFAAPQKLLAKRAAEAGDNIVEIGVGTGLVLPYYPARCTITGADLSHPMLLQARGKIGRPRMPRVRGFSVMDATQLALPDGAFDAAALPFVLPLIPDPENALNEAARVTRPGGRIVITSRFGAEGGVIARIEEKLEPLVARLGWSAAFKVSRILRWAAARSDIRLLENRKTLCYRVITLEKAGA